MGMEPLRPMARLRSGSAYSRTSPNSDTSKSIRNCVISVVLNDLRYQHKSNNDEDRTPVSRCPQMLSSQVLGRY